MGFQSHHVGQLTFPKEKRAISGGVFLALFDASLTFNHVPDAPDTTQNDSAKQWRDNIQCIYCDMYLD